MAVRALTTEGVARDFIDAIVACPHCTINLDGVASSLTQVLAETTNGQTITYLYGLGLVAQSSIEYHLTDGLGSVRQLADPGGQVLLSQTFDPYGNLCAQSSINRQWAEPLRLDRRAV